MGEDIKTASIVSLLVALVLFQILVFACCQSQAHAYITAGGNGIVSCQENVDERIECGRVLSVKPGPKNQCFPQCFEGNGDDSGVQDGRRITLQIGSALVKYPHRDRFILRCTSNEPVGWRFVPKNTVDEKSGSSQILSINRTVEGGARLACYVSDLCVQTSLLISQQGEYVCSPATIIDGREGSRDVHVSAKSDEGEEPISVGRRREDFQISFHQLGELKGCTTDCNYFQCRSPEIPSKDLQVQIIGCETLEECEGYAKSVEEGDIIFDAFHANDSSAAAVRFGLAVCSTRDKKQYNYWQFIQLEQEIVTFDPFSPEKTLPSLMSLDIHAKDDTRVYIGDSVSVDCFTSAFNFTGEPRLDVELRNGRTRLATLTGKKVKVYGRAVVHLSAKVKITDKDITAISCLGISKHDSKTQASLTCDVEVKEGVIPTIIKHPEETVVFPKTAQNVSITCEAIGDPCPELTWFKEGERYNDDLQLSYIRTVFCAGGNNKTESTIVFRAVDSTRGTNAGGLYTCNATNIRGTSLKHVRIELSAGPITYVFYALIVLVAGIIVAMGYLNSKSRAIIRKQKKLIQKLKEEQINEFEKGASTDDVVNEDEGNAHIRFRHVAPGCKLPVDSILLKEPLQTLGSGHFGQVVLGEDTRYGREGTEVAVKQLKHLKWDSLAAKDFLGEIKILSLLHENVHKHQEHVVQLVGYIADFDNDKVQLVMELCSGGNLEEYLVSKRPNFFGYRTNNVAVPAGTPGYVIIGNAFLTVKDLISYAYQIACGMEVLETVRVIHGDLAARNILLKDMDRRIVKIADFGLARTLGDPQYENSKPYRSLAIECWPTGSALTLKSDVWSYGVLLWEIFTLCEIPYHNFCWTDDQAPRIYDFLRNPMNRLERPTHAPVEIYKLMRKCWQHNPNDRPDFKSLSSEIKKVLDNFDNDVFNESARSQPPTPGYITNDQLPWL